MPKKVITRRQRKAAEAKRQSETNARNATDAQSGNAATAPAPNTLKVKPSCSGVRPKTKPTSEQPVAKASGTKSAQQQPLQQQQQVSEEAQLNPDGKTTVTVIVKDKTTQSDKKVFDLLVDENIKKKVGGCTQAALLPNPPSNEQSSFSKSLTRRAVATFTKIQKLSKVFNKKMNYKAPPATNAEPINLSGAQLDETVKTALNGPPGSDNKANKACNCEFCKVVLNQLFAGKTRANDRKVCKNSNRRLPNHLRTVSPGRNNIQKTELGEANCEDCKVQVPSVVTRRRIIQRLEKKEKMLEKDVIQKIKQINKRKRNKPMKEEQLLKTNNAKANKDNPAIQFKSSVQAVQTKIAKISDTMFPKLTSVVGTKAAPAAPIINETTRKTENILSQPKVDLSSAIQQLSVEPAAMQPPKMIGNTGYLILTGSTTQLGKQLTSLAEKNVDIPKYVLLEPGVTDKLEQQLADLEKNRVEILQRMRDKHSILATCRKRRLKGPSKYT